MTRPAILARLKRGCMSAIALSGGIDGAAATTGKGRSTCGNWNNRNMDDTPTLGDAFALDEVAVMQGQRPPIACAFVSELGGVVIMLPDAPADTAELATMLLDCTRELGELADTSRKALADGVVDGMEPAAIEQEAEDLIERAVAVREYARKLQGKPAVRAVITELEAM